MRPRRLWRLPRRIFGHGRNLCARHGWEVQTPLFGSDTRQLARRMQAGGLKATLCCVDTQQLSADFAGRDFDAALLLDLPTEIDPCGEHGEFHTCVHDGPMFDHPVRIKRCETVLRDARFAYTDFHLQSELPLQEQLPPE